MHSSMIQGSLHRTRSQRGYGRRARGLHIARASPANLRLRALRVRRRELLRGMQVGGGMREVGRQLLVGPATTICENHRN